jgi:hypothetical protein
LTSEWSVPIGTATSDIHQLGTSLSVAGVPALPTTTMVGQRPVSVARALVGAWANGLAR